jgi:hypothetical protein
MGMKGSTMRFREGYGAFVARATLTPAKARALAAAGHSRVALQVDFQGSTLKQKTAGQLAAETAVASAAGLVPDWWAWIRPGDRPGSGCRPGGVGALERRIKELLDAGVPAPRLFIADCEVGGGWSPSRPALTPVADTIRAAGLAEAGLSTHGVVGARWPVSAFSVWMPQLYRRASVTADWARRCLRSWRGTGGEFWLTLGAADDYSNAAAMTGDLGGLAELGAVGCWWWTARQLSGDKLAASVPQTRFPS